MKRLTILLLLISFFTFGTSAGKTAQKSTPAASVINTVTIITNTITNFVFNTNWVVISTTNFSGSGITLSRFTTTNENWYSNFIVTNVSLTLLCQNISNTYTTNIQPLGSITNSRNISTNLISFTNCTNFYFYLNWNRASAAAQFPADEDYSALVFNNKIWLFGNGRITGHVENFASDVWSSSDGIYWTQTAPKTAIPPRYGHSSAVFNKSMWIIGGSQYNDVWNSTDGINWNLANVNAGFSARNGHVSLVFDNKLWVIGGSKQNDVWYTADGTNWALANANADFPGRFGHSGLVYNNKMWIIGGCNNVDLNDVWYSSDGTNWYQATRNAQFEPKEYHTSFVYHNLMWVTGGYGGSGNDAWYSSDGTNWTRSVYSTQFPSRECAAGAVFNGKLWIIGGENGTLFNDVWDAQ